MKHKRSIILGLFLFIGIISISISLGYAEHILQEAYSYKYNTSGLSNYMSRIDLQGDCIYEDASGMSSYGIIVDVDNNFWV